MEAQPPRYGDFFGYQGLLPMLDRTSGQVVEEPWELSVRRKYVRLMIDHARTYDDYDKMKKSHEETLERFQRDQKEYPDLVYLSDLSDDEYENGNYWEMDPLAPENQ